MRLAERTTGMDSAPDVFMAVSNATAAVVSHVPAYLTYRAHTIVHAVGGDQPMDRTVTVRTDDGMALVRNEETGKDELRPAFPAPPTFDALSKFKLHAVITLQMGGRTHRTGDMSVTNIEPLHYESSPSHADAVAHAVKGYVVTFAPDASAPAGHLHLERNAAFKGDSWLRDVWYDPATMLPTRVVWGGPNDFVLDARYRTAEGAWVLESISAEAVMHLPLWMGRSALALRSSYSDYAFSATPPDPRLAPDANSR